MPDEDRTALEAYVRQAGWHVDPAQDHRWLHPQFPHVGPQTLNGAVEIVRSSLGVGREQGAGPSRIH